MKIFNYTGVKIILSGKIGPQRCLKVIYRILVCMLFFQPFDSLLIAQKVDTLRLDDVIDLTLENNYNIVVAENNVELARKNAENGAVGFYPTISLSGNYNYNQNNYSLTEFANPQMENIEERGAVTESYNAGINVNYNLLSWGKRTYRLDVAQKNVYLQQQSLELQVEQSVLNAVLQYLNAVNYYAQMLVELENLENSQRRFQRAQEQYRYGQYTRLQLLNAEVDLRTDSANFIRTKVDYKNAITRLNNEMGIQLDEDHPVDTSLTIDRSLSYENLLDQSLNNNPNYLSAKASVNNAELQVRINEADRYPTLDVSGGYSFSTTEYEANFLNLTQNLGWNAGISLNYNIFDGGRVRRNIETAELELRNRQEELEVARRQMVANLQVAWQNYQNNLELLSFYKRDVETAKLNYERSLLAIKTGQLTGLELREAQLRLTRARNSLIQAMIQAKRSELNLYFYSGSLVDQN